jgi:hypothetical protein
MSDTFTIGRLFVTTTNQPLGAPRFDLGITRETIRKRRIGDSWVIRVGSELAIVIGWWRKPQPRTYPPAGECCDQATSNGTARDASRDEEQHW